MGIRSYFVCARESDSVTSCVFRVIERIIGLYQPGGRSRHAGIQYGKSDADGKFDDASIVGDLLMGDSLPQSFRDAPGRLAIGIQQQNAKLLPTVSTRDICAPQLLF